MPDPLLDAYDVGEPSATLADRVLAQASAPSRSRRPLFAFAAAAAIVVVGAAYLLKMPAASHGDETVAARKSLRLGDRGIAVAEAGAHVVWNTDRDARVRQDAGDVFYRVERGGEFVVETPAGNVTVKGTCFRVEVGKMKLSKESVVASMIGAAVTATVLVTVYEGKVVLANERGQAELSAGDRAHSTAGSNPKKLDEHAALGSAPVDVPAEGVTREELLRREQALRYEVTALRERLQSVDGELSQEKQTSKRDKQETMVDASKEELLELAKQCRIGYDMPSLRSNDFAGSLDAELGISPDEKVEINKLHQAYTQRMQTQLRATFTEISGDTKAAEALSLDALQAEILERGRGKEDPQRILQRISQERAGLSTAPDPSTLGPLDRYYRMLTGVGETFEQDIAQVIGPERAHDARKKHNGWNSRHGTSFGCPGEK